MEQVSDFSADDLGTLLAYSRGRSVYLRSLEDWSEPPRELGKHDEEVRWLSNFHPEGDRLAASDESGEVKIWSITDSTEGPLRSFQAGELHRVLYDPTGRWLAAEGLTEGSPTVHLWDVTAPQGTDPLTLVRTDAVFHGVPKFSPRTPWLVTTNGSSAGFWPLTDRYPWVLRAADSRVTDVAFTPDGEWLISATSTGVRAWPLRGQNEGASRILLDRVLVSFPTVVFHPSGEYLAVASQERTVLLVPLDGGPIRELPGSSSTAVGMIIDFSPNGRLLAAVPLYGPAEEMVIQVWDLESGEVRTVGQVSGMSAYLGFDDDRRLRWSGGRDSDEGVGGERIFDLEGGSLEIVAEEGREYFRAVSSRESFMLVGQYRPEDQSTFIFWNSLDDADSRRITSHGAWIEDVAIDPSDRWVVTGGDEGLLQVGPVTGEEPHLLSGHRGLIRAVAISPDGQWIASGGDDQTVRLWPMPDLSKTPFHLRPLNELMETLHSLTNLRIVEDPEFSTGWKLDYAPFPGWEEVPEW